MRMITISMYDKLDAAKAAMKDLIKNGFTQEEISLISHEATLGYARSAESDEFEALVVGLKPMIIPGIGPVLAGGPVVSRLKGQEADRENPESLVNVLVERGIPDEIANAYAEGVRRGGVMVSVRMHDEMGQKSVELLNLHNPVDMKQMVVYWKEKGWTRFDPKAEPLEFEESNWPFTIVARPGEVIEHQEGESWPESITTSPGEKSTQESEINWPQNIIFPEKGHEEADQESNWPHDITTKPDD